MFLSIHFWRPAIHGFIGATLQSSYLPQNLLWVSFKSSSSARTWKFVVSGSLCIFALFSPEQELEKGAQLLQTGFHVNHGKRMNVAQGGSPGVTFFFLCCFYASSNSLFLSFRQTIIVRASLFVPLPHLTSGNSDQGNYLNHTQHHPTKYQRKTPWATALF